MRKLVFAAVLIALITATGCVPFSIHPPCTSADWVAEPAILGAWGEDDNNQMTFVTDGDKTYKLIHVDEGLSAEFEVHLFKVNDWLMMDIAPSDSPQKINETFTSMMLPLHFMCRVDQTEPALVLRPLSYDWLKTTLEDDPNLLQHTEHSGSILITAETEQIRKFLREHLTEDSFDEEIMEGERLR